MDTPVLSPSFETFRQKITEYLPPEDVAQVEEAYRFSAEAHAGQTRITGEPYVTHPLAVADIVADWKLDAQALIAGLLHDVMEDTYISKEEITARFGKNAAELVDGLSKLDKIKFSSHIEAQAENFRKMLMAMARDLRVILIKLADRLHNMRTLDPMRPDKRRRIAKETLEIYAPIANRLGLNALFIELQELAFKHKYPLRYRVLAKALRAARGNRREIVGKVRHAIEERLPQWNITAKVQGREKHIYSIYRKMEEKHLSFAEVLDVYGFRVIVPDVQSCYLAIGALHSMYKPKPGKFKDYLAIPKGNGYRSLHTTLIDPHGTPIEVQVRTRQMHNVAESGVAAHWMYKEDNFTLADLQQKTHSWLQSLLELQSTSVEAAEFLEHVKVDLFPREVYVFSPSGQIFSLPRGSTPVDFAYAVHTDIGNRCISCRINGEMASLRTELNNGDRVEIITTPHANPNPAWLTHVRTGKARAQIRHFMKTSHHTESVELGERLLNQALRPLGLTLAQVSDFSWDRFLRERNIRNREEIFADIGLGKRLPAIVARRLTQTQDSETGRTDVVKAKASGGPILIRGSEGVSVALAECCQPIPGDPIIGTLRKGQGLEIHLHDCPVVAKLRGDRGRWIDVEWEKLHEEQMFDVSVRILSKGVRGVLGRIATALTEEGCNIQNVEMENEQGIFISFNFLLQVRDRMHLANVMRSIRRIPEIMRITRIRNDALPF